MATDFRRKEILPDITEQIVTSYHELGTINHLGHCPLPSYSEVIAILTDLSDEVSVLHLICCFVRSLVPWML